MIRHTEQSAGLSTPTRPEMVQGGVPPIEGFAYVPDFLDPRTRSDLLVAVDREPWLTDLKRRVQHYGFRYDYRARTVDSSMRLGPLPEWTGILAARLTAEGFFGTVPDQVIVNEYLPGQGIAPHVDCEPCFGPIIASVSLGSACILVFQRVGTNDRVDVRLEPGSLLVIRDAARYAWTHAIPARKTDVIDGRKVARGRRVSLTFRNVVVAARG